MSHLTFLKKEINDVNQYLKSKDNPSYFYDFSHECFYMKHDQSLLKLEVKMDILFKSNKTSFKYLLVENSIELYGILKELDTKQEYIINESGLVTLDGKLLFNKIRLTNNIEALASIVDKFDTEFTHILDSGKFSVVYDENSVFNNVSINDFIEINKYQYDLYGHKLLYAEFDISKKTINVVSSKTKLSLELPTLITLNTFKSLKVTKKDPFEFFKVLLNSESIQLLYGNTKYKFTYQYNVFNFSTK
jgi:hypothetical protein